MHSFKRSERLRALMQREIAAIIREEVKDPRIGFMTITNVDLTENLQFARVFVSPMGSDDQRADTMKGIKNATRFIKTSLSKKLKIKYLPDIRFVLDSSPIEADKINRIIHGLHRDEGSDEEDTE